MVVIRTCIILQIVIELCTKYNLKNIIIVFSSFGECNLSHVIAHFQMYTELPVDNSTTTENPLNTCNN